jgi:rubredoxin
MWLLWHHQKGTRVVPGGRTFKEQCPTCNERTKFEEIEIRQEVGAFFVDLVTDKERAFRCRVCGDVFDLRESEPEDRSALAAPKVDRTAELAAEQRRRDAERAARDVKIEDELAELKKRLRK